jgi:hypothetical protein
LILRCILIDQTVPFDWNALEETGGGGEQWFEQRGACRVGDAPGEDPVAAISAADLALLTK